MALTSNLVRPRRGHGGVLAGVCAALADRFGVNTTLIRLAFLVFAFVGAGEIVYLVLWLLIPRQP